MLNIVATYGRSLYALVIGLFCGRWAFMALGEVDYGLMGLVGGLVGFVAFFNGLMASAVGRFYAVSVGAMHKSGDEKGLEECRKWFNTALSIHVVLPIILVVGGYPCGSWLIEHFLTIPIDRIYDCQWVWRFTCLSCFIAMVNVPFQAMYTAKQEIAELTVYSFITTTVNVFFLYYIVTHQGRWLVPLVAWTCLLGVIPQIIIAVRAITKYDECRLRRTYLFRVDAIFQIVKYAYARLITELAMMLSGQARAILVNKYMGPQCNASMSIGTAVSGHAMTLSGSLGGAMWPAIANKAGEGDVQSVYDYCFIVCRISSVLILIFAIPIILEINEILRLWLVNPPPFAGEICVAILAGEVLNRLTDGHWMAVLGLGQGVVRYSQGVSIAGFAFIPMTWLLFVFGCGMWSIVIGIIFMGGGLTCLRVIMARKVIGYPIGVWLRNVVAPIFIVMIVSLTIGCIPRVFMNHGFVRIVCTTVLTESVLGLLLWQVVLNPSEKIFVRTRFERVFAFLKWRNGG